MLINLLIVITLLNHPTAKAECLEDSSKQELSVKEFLTLLQHIQSDTSENLRSVQSATSVNIQTVMSAISKQSSNTDSNLINIIDAVESLSSESHVWRNELSDTMTKMFNQTMNMIVNNADDGNNTNTSVLRFSNAVENLTSNLDNVINDLKDGILTSVRKVESLSSESNLWRNELSETMTKMFNQTMNILVNVDDDANNNDNNSDGILKLTNAVGNLTSSLDNGITDLKDGLLTGITKFMDQQNNDSINVYQMMQNNSEIPSSLKIVSSVNATLFETNKILTEIKDSSKNSLDAQTTDISSMKDAFAETNKLFAEIKSRAPYLILKDAFTIYNGRIILLPRALGGTRLTWQASVDRCSKYGAVPFIPRIVEEFKYMQRVNSGITGSSGLWLPANDIAVEGAVVWYDGTDASTILKTFDWNHNDGAYPGDNNDANDCVNIWTSYSNKLEMDPCTSTSMWPMICEIL